MKEIVWKNPWSDRFLFLEKYIPKNVSIIDFGCGNKQILDYCSPLYYTGVDIIESADIIADLNTPFKIRKKYDLGLILGVFEHLENPEYTLSNIYKSAESFIVLTSRAKMKKEWKHNFDKETIETLQKKYFTTVKSDLYPRYTVTLAKNENSSILF